MRSEYVDCAMALTDLTKTASYRRAASILARSLRGAAGASRKEIRKGLGLIRNLPARHNDYATMFAAGALPGAASELIGDDPNLVRALKSSLVWGGGGVLAKHLVRPR